MYGTRTCSYIHVYYAYMLYGLYMYNVGTKYMYMYMCIFQAMKLNIWDTLFTNTRRERVSSFPGSRMCSRTFHAWEPGNKARTMHVHVYTIHEDNNLYTCVQNAKYMYMHVHVRLGC